MGLRPADDSISETEEQGHGAFNREDGGVFLGEGGGISTGS